MISVVYKLPAFVPSHLFDNLAIHFIS